MTAKVLVSDKLSKTAVGVFSDNGIEVDYLPDLGKDKEKLAAVIGDYDAIAVRSATKLSEKVLRRADRLKVIGRAGIGVDNVDVKAATRKGIVVMNTPYGNSITTAEHTIALMMALARQIPSADISTQAGKWEKSRFMGSEIAGKTLGIVGCGNIGSIVADRAQGMKMKVIAHDPFLSHDRARDLGVEKVELEQLFARADFVSLHTPLTEKTAKLVDAAALDKMKNGVRVINCARGGLVDEQALANAIVAGKVAGAAFDVFEQEPAIASPLFGLANVICTPHLGASTREAQENVALQIAAQISNFLNYGAVSNAINMPSMTAEEAPRLAPFVRLAQHLGSFCGQVTESPIERLEILYDGSIAEMNVSALTSAAIAGIMKPLVADVNMVSAPVMAKERGIKVSVTTRDKSGVFDAYMKINVVTETQERSIAGTVFSDGKPRLIQIKGINLDAEIGTHMLYLTNRDVPGIIGMVGNAFGQASANIANFTLGRDRPGGNAIALLYLDQPASADLLAAIQSYPAFTQVKPLDFDVD